MVLEDGAYKKFAKIIYFISITCPNKETLPPKVFFTLCSSLGYPRDTPHFYQEPTTDEPVGQAEFSQPSIAVWLPGMKGLL